MQNYSGAWLRKELMVRASGKFVDVDIDDDEGVNEQSLDDSDDQGRPNIGG